MTKINIEEEVVEQDDDPTADLEIISEQVFLESETEEGHAPESDLESNGLTGLGAEIGDAKEAITNLKSELKERAEAINTLQFELEQLRALSTSLEQEVRISEEVVKNLGDELHSARRKQNNTEDLLKICDSEIAALKRELSANEESQADLPQQADSADSCSELQQVNPEADNSANDDTDQEQLPSRMIVAQDSDTSSSYPIGSGEISLGSSPDNDVRIESHYISRHHAQFVSSPTECVLKDMGSTNGTFVNSKRIRRHALSNGDSITIGKLRFEFVEQRSQPSHYEAEASGTEART